MKTINDSELATKIGEMVRTLPKGWELVIQTRTIPASRPKSKEQKTKERKDYPSRDGKDRPKKSKQIKAPVGIPFKSVLPSSLSSYSKKNEQETTTALQLP